MRVGRLPKFLDPTPDPRLPTRHTALSRAERSHSTSSLGRSRQPTQYSDQIVCDAGRHLFTMSIGYSVQVCVPLKLAGIEMQ
ncbi:hypothetical protein Dda_6946 [Drechslerella dactyloides]|uniref:Uncharacterized protein n=1 Tax=Drechslerella dactyloides TaxID=74499 RepID=A0AAD6IU19_DREDA|nr:hypothetical protein Dda_6946 [Drechslerella dactyloides]